MVLGEHARIRRETRRLDDCQRQIPKRLGYLADVGTEASIWFIRG